MRIGLIALSLLLAPYVRLLGGVDSGVATALDVVLLPSIQYAHADIWSKTPVGRSPANSRVGQVVRGQSVHILVFATQYGVGTDGNAAVDYAVSFIRPDGKTSSTHGGLQLIPSGPAQDPRHVRKATQMVGFIAEKDDPLGTWRVLVEATDKVTAATARGEQSFTVVSDEVLDAPLPLGTDHGRWLMGYHHKPVPQELLAAVKLIAETPPPGAKPRRDSVNGAVLGFFEQVLADNPWLLAHVVGRLEKSEGRERELLATCLAYAKRDDLAFPKTLPEKAREAFMLQQGHTWPVPAKEPLKGTELDVLWGRFFASGRYAPIRDLVAVLAYHPHKDALDEYKKLQTKPAKLPVEAIKGAVFHVALSSLRSNIQQDKVVRDYCEGMLLRKELPQADHVWLAAAFQAAIKNLQQAASSGTPAKKQD